MMDTLHNMAMSSTFQENQHFINGIPMFKSKNPQFFDDWLEQVDKLAVLTNKDPYKLALQNLRDKNNYLISTLYGMEQN